MTGLEESVLSHIREDEVVSFLQEIVRIPSFFPPGDSRKVAEVCVKKMQSAGIEAEVITPPDSITKRFGDGCLEENPNSYQQSALGIIRGNGPQMLWNAHIDTVPIEDASKWICDPFSGDIMDGYIYGRGTGDDKGSVAAQVMAAVALKKAGVKLKGTLVVNPVGDEEACSMRGTEWLRDAGYYDPDIVIVGEQTNNLVAVAERGFHFFTVTIKGRACHGAMPWNGNNAIVKAARFINEIDKNLRPALEKRTHPYLPHSTVNVAQIKGGVKSNVVPEIAEVVIDRRTVPGETLQSIREELTEILERLKAEDDFEYTIRCDFDSGLPTNTSPDDALVKNMNGILKELTGEERQPTGYRQGSDARLFAHKPIPIVIFGPSDPAVGHSPNERVSISQLVEATQVYALTAMRVLGVEEEIGSV